MIELIEDLPEATLGFVLHGEISGSHVDSVLLPAIERAFEQHERIKALLVFSDDFSGFTLEAAWDDTILGLRHWDGFERLAVVSDVPWLRQGLRAMSLLLPYPVRLFDADQQEQAERWLSESFGTIHVDCQDDVVTVALIGRLDPDAYQRIHDDLANIVAHQDPLRLLLDLRQFDGWLGLGALTQHLALMGEFRHQPQRVAVIASHGWQLPAQRVLGRFVNARTRAFDTDHVEDAQQWLLAT
ncbi:MAG: hypothetical protein RLZZ336_353 [Cyanobacteriota bacterium]|jgi:hypothetical protein